MSKPRVVLGVVVAAAVAACGSKPKPAAPAPAPEPAADVSAPIEEREPPPPPLPAIPSSPAPAPAELIATASAPAPVSLLPLWGAYLERVTPGAGQLATRDGLAAATDGALALAGVDLARPVRALMLDPVRFPSPFVFVVGVSDEAALAAAASQRGLRYQVHGGFAAIGQQPAMVEAAGFALTTLVAAPLPPAPTVDVDVGYLMLHYGSMVEALTADAAAEQPPEQRELVRSMMTSIVSLLGQIDHAQLAGEVVGERATGSLRLQAKPGTALAAFLAAQAPATFAQLERLRPGAVMMGGNVELGGLVETWMGFMEQTMTRLYGDRTAQVMEMMRAWLTVDIGEVGMTAEPADQKLTVSALFAVSDGARLAKLWAEMIKVQVAVTTGPIKTTVSTSNHRGVKLTSTAGALTKSATDVERAGWEASPVVSKGSFAVVGNTGLMVMGVDPLPLARALVDALKDKRTITPLPPAAAAVLDEARRRRESLLVAMDLPRLAALGGGSRDPAAPPIKASEPTVFGAAADGGALTFRVTIPAGQVAPLAAATQGAPSTTRSIAAPGTSVEVAEALDFIDRSADRLCACKDLTCANAVMEGFASMKEPSTKPTDAEMKRAMAAAERMAACHATLLSAEPSP